MNDYHISTDKSKLDLDTIDNYLSKRSYWAKGRSREKIVKSIQNSLCFGVYTDAGEQVGFARVLSDYAVFAWIMDVFILEDFRSQGLGKMLMKAITEHPDLQGLERWGLGTKDAHGLYEQFGFRKLKTPETKMEKTNLPTEF
jgi:GNAT superfamily N-acetyltransferase